jgi:phage gpG-like protein
MKYIARENLDQRAPIAGERGDPIELRASFDISASIDPERAESAINNTDVLAEVKDLIAEAINEAYTRSGLSVKSGRLKQWATEDFDVYLSLSGFTIDLVAWWRNIDQPIYAGIHQFGNGNGEPYVITPKHGNYLHWIDDGGRHHFATSVSVPPRPYLELTQSCMDKIAAVLDFAIRTAPTSQDTGERILEILPSADEIVLKDQLKDAMEDRTGPDAAIITAIGGTGGVAFAQSVFIESWLSAVTLAVVRAESLHEFRRMVLDGQIIMKIRAEHFSNFAGYFGDARDRTNFKLIVGAVWKVMRHGDRKALEDLPMLLLQYQTMRNRHKPGEHVELVTSD